MQPLQTAHIMAGGNCVEASHWDKSTFWRMTGELMGERSVKSSFPMHVILAAEIAGLSWLHTQQCTLDLQVGSLLCKGPATACTKACVPWPSIPLGRRVSFPAEQRHYRTALRWLHTARVAQEPWGGSQGQDAKPLRPPIHPAGIHHVKPILTWFQEWKKHTHKFFLWIYLININLVLLRLCLLDAGVLLPAVGVGEAR